MKFKQALFFVSLFSISARCQPYLNIANFQFGKYEPSTVYTGSNDWETTTDYIDFNINLPIRFKSKQLLLISPRWMQKSYFSESPIIQNLTNGTSVVLDGTSTFNSTYNSLMFPVSWVQPLKDTTKKIVISGIYRFNYEKRLNPSSSNDQIGGAIIYSKKHSKKFGWQAGLYYNRETFGNLFLPLVGVDWHPSDRIFCWALLPQYAVIDYMVAPSIHVGFGFRGIQESYTENGLQNHFNFSEGHLRLYADYYIPKTSFVLTFEVGNTVAREFVFNNQDNGKNSQTKIYPTESMFSRVGIAYRFVTDKAFRTKSMSSQ
jgi:hypothetical protein